MIRPGVAIFCHLELIIEEKVGHRLGSGLVAYGYQHWSPSTQNFVQRDLVPNQRRFCLQDLLNLRSMLSVL